MARGKQFDVLGLGCAAVDDILYVEQYPHLRTPRFMCSDASAIAAG